MTTAPRLETERLILRAHVLDDFADSATMWSDPVVTRYIGGAPLGEEASWARLLRYVGHWSLLGFGYWTLRERGTERFVGEAGFADFRRELDPPVARRPEAGWVLAPWAHGRGLATEAVRAILAWGDEHLTHGSTVCLIHPEHAASVRVADKCGYAKIGASSYKGSQTLVLERPWRGGA
jgi:RimJ/RimL family protein N-acetyltransferase